MNNSDYITMELLDVIDKPFSAQLVNFFCANNRNNHEAMFDYISVGQYYWLFKEFVWVKIRVTHKFGGVIFYVMEDSDIDYHFDIGSALCCTMIPCKIFRHELAYLIAKCRGMETEEVYDRLKKQGFYIPEGLEVEII